MVYEKHLFFFFKEDSLTVEMHSREVQVFLGDKNVNDLVITKIGRTGQVDWKCNICDQRSKLTFSRSRLLATFNCKMVAITQLSPEFWSPEIFSNTRSSFVVCDLEFTMIEFAAKLKNSSQKILYLACPASISLFSSYLRGRPSINYYYLV